jgi:hypothetical protein
LYEELKTVIWRRGLSEIRRLVGSGSYTYGPHLDLMESSPQDWRCRAKAVFSLGLRIANGFIYAPWSIQDEGGIEDEDDLHDEDSIQDEGGTQDEDDLHDEDSIQDEGGIQDEDDLNSSVQSATSERLQTLRALSNIWQKIASTLAKHDQLLEILLNIFNGPPSLEDEAERALRSGDPLWEVQRRLQVDVPEKALESGVPLPDVERLFQIDPSNLPSQLPIILKKAQEVLKALPMTADDNFSSKVVSEFDSKAVSEFDSKFIFKFNSEFVSGLSDHEFLNFVTDLVRKVHMILGSMYDIQRPDLKKHKQASLQPISTTTGSNYSRQEIAEYIQLFAATVFYQALLLLDKSADLMLEYIEQLVEACDGERSKISRRMVEKSFEFPVHDLRHLMLGGRPLSPQAGFYRLCIECLAGRTPYAHWSQVEMSVELMRRSLVQRLPNIVRRWNAGEDLESIRTSPGGISVQGFVERCVEQSLQCGGGKETSVI